MFHAAFNVLILFFPDFLASNVRKLALLGKVAGSSSEAKSTQTGRHQDALVFSRLLKVANLVRLMQGGRCPATSVPPLPWLSLFPGTDYHQPQLPPLCSKYKFKTQAVYKTTSHWPPRSHLSFQTGSASFQLDDSASTTDISHLGASSHRAASHHPRSSSPRYSFLTPSRSITGSMTNFSATPLFQSLVCGMSYALAPHSSTLLLE